MLIIFLTSVLEIEDIVNDWNYAINNKDKEKMTEVYNDCVIYYGDLY
jgi:ketosteroid isomerase-like protein